MKYYRLKFRDDGTYLTGHTYQEAFWSLDKKNALVLPKSAAFALARTFNGGLDDIAVVSAPDCIIF